MAKSILIADADQQTAALILSTLEGKGFRGENATSGKNALETIQAQPKDMVVVGEQLEDIDGIGFIVKLRAVSRSAKIVFISNQWRDSDVYQMLTRDYGVSLVVHRPLKRLLLGAQLASLLNTTKADISTGKEQEHQALIALRARFLTGLGARIAALTQSLETASSKSESLNESIRLSHNMKGTAATAGFALLLATSAKLEATLAEIKNAGPAQTYDEEPWSQVASQFELLRRAALDELDANSQAERVVDDDSAMAKILFVGNGELDTTSPHLTSGGLSVKFIATSAADAIETATNNVLDAVLIDAGEPLGTLTPLRIARELRGMIGNESLPLAFIKPENDILDPIEAAHAGASLFLDRPVQAGALREGVEYLLGVRQGGRPRVLVVDDDPDFSGMIVNTLGREGMLVRSINDPTLAVETMESFVPDLVLLDVMMPVMTGFEVCRILRANPRWQDTPMLFLTAETELDARLAAFDAGGDDYLPKPVAAVELLTRVKVRLDRSRMMRERMDKDVLTGLLLRRPFMEQVSALIAEGERHKFIFSIALLDVDKFKNINDTYGHLAGDRVLSHLGHLLKRRFRVEDIRGRWGGEEFIVALRHESKTTTQGAMQRVLEELRSIRFEGDHGESFSVTFTAGLAHFPADGQTLEQLVRAADARLYEGKASGRNRIMV